MMQTRFIQSEEELLTLRDPWNALLHERPENDMPFFSWDWFYHSWRHFGEPQNRELAVVVVENNDRLLGILPLIRGNRKSMGIPYRTLEFCNVGMNPRNTAYADAESDDVAVFKAMREHIFHNKNQWDMLELSNVSEATSFQQFCRDKYTQPFGMIETHGLLSPFIKLDGNLDDYLAGLSRGTRKNFRKHLQDFRESSSPSSVRFFEVRETTAEGLEQLLEVHRNSWKGEFQNPHYPAFYREITPILCERGEAVILILALDNVPIAAAYMLRKGGSFFGCIRDFDRRYREFAPGILLLHFQLERLAEERGTVFDFCGSNYDHKNKFATGHRAHSTFQFFHRGWKSRFLFSAKTKWLPMLRKILRKPQPQDVMAIVDEY